MSLFPSEAQGPWRLTIPLEGVPSSPMLRLEISRPRFETLISVALNLALDLTQDLNRPPLVAISLVPRCGRHMSLV